MDEELQEDWLDARLREEAPYIDDAGFTARVMKQLPARPAQRSYRGFILLALTFCASLITYFVSDGGRFVVAAFQGLAAQPLIYICIIALACCLLLTAAAAGAAVSNIRGER